VPSGTVNLFWNSAIDSPVTILNSTAKQTWSIAIDPSGVARLYDGADGTGSLLGEAALDVNKEWYARLMLEDGSSGGFGSGAANFDVYSVSSTTTPEPSTFVIFATGGIGLVGWTWRRKRAAA
jgi:hypothetical protein